jgi:hypothetical protein
MITMGVLLMMLIIALPVMILLVALRANRVPKRRVEGPSSPERTGSA